MVQYEGAYQRQVHIRVEGSGFGVVQTLKGLPVPGVHRQGICCSSLQAAIGLVGCRGTAQELGWRG